MAEGVFSRRRWIDLQLGDGWFSDGTRDHESSSQGSRFRFRIDATQDSDQESRYCTEHGVCTGEVRQVEK